MGHFEFLNVLINWWICNLEASYSNLRLSGLVTFLVDFGWCVCVCVCIAYCLYSTGEGSYISLFLASRTVLGLLSRSCTSAFRSEGNKQY